ncbi:hypothetical protein MGA5115_02610 [Marinomonas gallaica]|uniref:Tlde1 domain-containing protein n=1 Tax=Marinomonas gallaica TaxID=1806667 RepID=A0A1C3JTT4_9GAMM|nr:tlde1 domain-containing protein [Marinomonas gallaica]SBT18479.1 hypothetical protein MGA5115_02610 [Marinomonas gallaica]SBT22812.1 hypothetical protein MGA5116_03442 [Marinomonas gallaica]
MRLIFSIQKQKLIITTPAWAAVLNATSGRDKCMNNSSEECLSQSWHGPIPIGEYFINPRELSDPNIFGDILRNFRPDSPGDWGSFRIRIHAKEDTETHGRDNFFLHGGSVEGSAGCIDVGGGLFGSQHLNNLLTAIRMSKHAIDLEVISE